MIDMLADSSSHATIGDALSIFAVLAGMALIIWAVSKL